MASTIASIGRAKGFMAASASLWSPADIILKPSAAAVALTTCSNMLVDGVPQSPDTRLASMLRTSVSFQPPSIGYLNLSA